MEDNIIKVDETKQTVNARNIHEFVKSKQDFSDWIKKRIKKYGWVEGEDYFVVSKPTSDLHHKSMEYKNQQLTGTFKLEYHCTFDMAKELAMVENNEKGRQARKYFIDCENRLKQVKDHFSLTDSLSRCDFGRLLIQAGETIIHQEHIIETKDRLIADLEPKAIAYDQFLDVKNCMTMADVAQTLYPETHLGRNNLFKLLREKKLLKQDNTPYQRYVDTEYFIVRQVVIEKPDGKEVKSQTLITPAGLDYIRKKVRENFKVVSEISS